MLARTIVFSTCPDTLLAVERALQLASLRVGIDGAQENGFVLIGCEL